MVTADLVSLLHGTITRVSGSIGDKQDARLLFPAQGFLGRHAKLQEGALICLCASMLILTGNSAWVIQGLSPAGSKPNLLDQIPESSLRVVQTLDGTKNAYLKAYNKQASSHPSSGIRNQDVWSGS